MLIYCQAEYGIRDWSVTGVQTCALPICKRTRTDWSKVPVPPRWPAGRGGAGAFDQSVRVLLPDQSGDGGQRRASAGGPGDLVQETRAWDVRGARCARQAAGEAPRRVFRALCGDDAPGGGKAGHHDGTVDGDDATKGQSAMSTVVEVRQLTKSYGGVTAGDRGSFSLATH